MELEGCERQGCSHFRRCHAAHLRPFQGLQPTSGACEHCATGASEPASERRERGRERDKWGRERGGGL
eukprot:3259458-Rhodomonas_salina.1